MVGPPRGERSPVNRPLKTPSFPSAHVIANRAFSTVQRFLRIEAASGVVLVAAAALALLWANSVFAESYHALWHLPLSTGLGELSFTKSLHFWINDILMTLFFLVVGMEIRREIHEGALSTARQALLPVAAAVGGVVVPALIYLGFNADPVRAQGWAVPAATDIAFAVGVLALLGRWVPVGARIFLLAVAIIDDVMAVLIIAFFYTGGLDYGGFGIAAIGLAMVVGLQRLGINSALGYILPGAIVWAGFLSAGVHPTLAGVVLGLMTPPRPLPTRENSSESFRHAAEELRGLGASGTANRYQEAFGRLRAAHRDRFSPAVRMQTLLHPWVAFGVMPLFALANAGITLRGIDASIPGTELVVFGVATALIVGKPLGVISVTWMMVKLGWCRLPPESSWYSIVLIGLLAGIGFTMSIFIAMLAFDEQTLLTAAKLGVLLGSLMAALAGLSWGVFHRRRLRILDSP